MRKILVVVTTLAATFLSIAQLSDNEPVMAATETALVECLGYNEPGCQEAWINTKMSQDGPRETVAAVGGSLSPVIVASCHTLMHKIGIAAHETYRDRDIQNLLLEADSDCQFGYQHGVFIAASGDIIASTSTCLVSALPIASTLPVFWFSDSLIINPSLPGRLIKKVGLVEL